MRQPITTKQGKQLQKKNHCQNRQGELINTIKKGLRAGVNFLQKVFSASSQASFRSVFLFLFTTVPLKSEKVL